MNCLTEITDTLSRSIMMKRKTMLTNSHAARQIPGTSLVIGGGATGMGVAVDAAARGFERSSSKRTTSARAPAAAAPSSSMAASAISSRATFRWSWRP